MLCLGSEGHSMPKLKYHVRLSSTERDTLQNLISKGAATARSIMHANVLLAADENNIGKRMSEEKIAALMHVSKQTVQNIRQLYAENGLEAAIERKKRDTPPVPVKVTGDVEARIIALSCSAPPPGRSRWTLRLLAEKAVELELIDSIAHVTVGNLLKKMNSNRI